MTKKTLALALLLFATPVFAAEDRPKILVLDLKVAGGTGPDIASAFSEAIAQEVDKRGFFESLSSEDVRTILGVERQKQLLGCSEGSECQTELAGALGARFALSGTLAKLGEVYQLTLQTIDTQKAQPIARSTRVGRSYDVIRDQLPWAVAEATGTPLPPTPTHILPYSLMGGGGLLFAASGVVGVQALTAEQTIVSELRAGKNNPAILKDYGYYDAQRRNSTTMKTLSLGGLIAGAALLGGGIWLYRDESSEAQVAWVPAPNGFAFVGVLP